MKQTLQFLILILILTQVSNAQEHPSSYEKCDTLFYDLLIDDEVIGEFKIYKGLNKDSLIDYIAESNADYRLLFSFNINFNYFTQISSDGEYLNSKFSYILNDDVKESNWVNCIGGKCFVYEGNEIVKVIEQEIPITSMQMYFQEPKKDDWVFSERFLDQFEIQHLEESYLVKFPGGNSNEYFYKNGTCNRVEIKSMFANLSFVKK